MNTDHMAVSEIFGPTFQGEGPSTGQRAFFLRLGGCNLACSWCDTPYTWDWEKYNPREEVTTMTLDDVASVLQIRGYVPTDLLVITGGEPMLQQERIVALLKNLDQGVSLYQSMRARIEIETNGTITPNDLLLSWGPRIQFNVSPKLASSGNLFVDRFDSHALVTFAMLERARFKFVVTQPTDLDDVATLLRHLPFQPSSKIWIMPEGTDPDTLERRLKWLAPMVLERGWNLTTRLHVNLWKNERGR